MSTSPPTAGRWGRRSVVEAGPRFGGRYGRGRGRQVCHGRAQVGDEQGHLVAGHAVPDEDALDDRVVAVGG